MMYVHELPHCSRASELTIEPCILFAPRRKWFVAVDDEELGVTITIAVVVLRWRQREVRVIVGVVLLVIADAWEDGRPAEKRPTRTEELVDPFGVVRPV